MNSKSDSVQPEHHPAITDNNETEKKNAFVKPKLKYVEPKLEKHGSVENVTGGFFGSFSP